MATCPVGSFRGRIDWPFADAWFSLFPSKQRCCCALLSFQCNLSPQRPPPSISTSTNNSQRDWTGGRRHVRHLLRRPGQGEGAARLPLVHPHRRHQGREEVRGSSSAALGEACYESLANHAPGFVCSLLGGAGCRALFSSTAAGGTPGRGGGVLISTVVVARQTVPILSLWNLLDSVCSCLLAHTRSCACAPHTPAPYSRAETGQTSDRFWASRNTWCHPAPLEWRLP